jgi:large repetitive protein
MGPLIKQLWSGYSMVAVRSFSIVCLLLFMGLISSCTGSSSGRTAADLTGITVSEGNLDPAFSPEVSTYKATVPFTASTYEVTLKPLSGSTTMTVNGVAVTADSPSPSIPLTQGTNTITIVVTSTFPKETKTYTINVVRVEASTNPKLNTLVISGGSISPTFDADTTAYTASVPYSNASITITPTSKIAGGTVSVNSATVSSGVASGPLALSVGANVITVVSTAQDGSTTKTYTITVTRAAASTNKNLSALTLSSGTLSPVFASNTVSYTASVLYAVTGLQVTPTLSDSLATMKVNGVTNTSGAASGNLSLSVGSNVITIIVTAEDASTKTYTLTVTRGASSTNNDLNGLVVTPGVLSPAFSSGTLSYSVLVSNLASTMTVTPTLAANTSTLEISWNSGSYTTTSSGVASSSLTPVSGTNSLNVRVTSESGAQKIYAVSIEHDLCPAGYYEDGTHACIPVTVGYYSPAGDNARYACTNAPAHAAYSSPTASSISCPWSCTDGYLTTNGTTCTSYPNATVLSCASNEVAVGLNGRYGSIIDRLGIRCATISGTTVGTTISNGPDYGGMGGGPFSADCSASNTVYGLAGDLTSYSGETRTGQIQFNCINTVSSAVSTAFPGAGSYWGGSSGLGSFSFQCGSGANPYGSFVNGIIIDNAGGAAYVGPILGITCR